MKDFSVSCSLSNFWFKKKKTKAKTMRQTTKQTGKVKDIVNGFEDSKDK